MIIIVVDVVVVAVAAAADASHNTLHLVIFIRYDHTIEFHI